MTTTPKYPRGATLYLPARNVRVTVVDTFQDSKGCWHVVCHEESGTNRFPESELIAAGVKIVGGEK